MPIGHVCVCAFYSFQAWRCSAARRAGRSCAALPFGAGWGWFPLFGCPAGVAGLAARCRLVPPLWVVGGGPPFGVLSLQASLLGGALQALYALCVCVSFRTFVMHVCSGSSPCTRCCSSPLLSAMAVSPQISYRRMLARIQEDRGLDEILMSKVGPFLDAAAEIQRVVDGQRQSLLMSNELLRECQVFMGVDQAEINGLRARLLELRQRQLE